MHFHHHSSQHRTRTGASPRFNASSTKILIVVALIATFALMTIVVKNHQNLTTNLSSARRQVSSSSASTTDSDRLKKLTIDENDNSISHQKENSIEEASSSSSQFRHQHHLNKSTKLENNAADDSERRRKRNDWADLFHKKLHTIKRISIPSQYAYPVTMTDKEQHHHKSSLLNINRERVVLFDTDGDDLIHRIVHPSTNKDANVQDANYYASLFPFANPLNRQPVPIALNSKWGNVFGDKAKKSKRGKGVSMVDVANAALVVSSPTDRNGKNGSDTDDVVDEGELPRKSIRFFVIGDFGGPGRQPQRNVATKMATVAKIEHWGAAFKKSLMEAPLLLNNSKHTKKHKKEQAKEDQETVAAEDGGSEIDNNSSSGSNSSGNGSDDDGTNENQDAEKQNDRRAKQQQQQNKKHENSDRVLLLDDENENNNNNNNEQEVDKEENNRAHDLHDNDDENNNNKRGNHHHHQHQQHRGEKNKQQKHEHHRNHQEELPPKLHNKKHHNNNNKQHHHENDQDGAASSTTASSIAIINATERKRIEDFIQSFYQDEVDSSTPISANQQQLLHGRPLTGFNRPGSEFLDFIISTGDNFYEQGLLNEFDLRTKRNFENVYTDPSFIDKVWFLILGNHCHGAHGVFRDVAGTIRYTLESPRRRFWQPSSYFAHEFVAPSSSSKKSKKKNAGDSDEQDHGNSVFIAFIDTYDVSPHMTKMSPTQIEWLKWRLSRTRARWRFVVGHRPALSAGKKHGTSKYMQNLLFPIFKQYNVSGYFCGDDHQIQVIKQVKNDNYKNSKVDGQEQQQREGETIHVVSGGGSRLEPIKPLGLHDVVDHNSGETLYQRKQYGFVSVEVVSDHLVRLAVHHAPGSDDPEEALASYVYEIRQD